MRDVGGIEKLRHAFAGDLARLRLATRCPQDGYEERLCGVILRMRPVKRRQNRRANPAPSLATSQPEKAPDKKPARTRAAWPGRV